MWRLLLTWGRETTREKTLQRWRSLAAGFSGTRLYSARPVGQRPATSDLYVLQGGFTHFRLSDNLVHGDLSVPPRSWCATNTYLHVYSVPVGRMRSRRLTKHKYGLLQSIGDTGIHTE